MAKPGETLSLSQLLEKLMQETQEGLQQSGIINPQILELGVDIKALSSFGAVSSTQLNDAIKSIISQGLAILSSEMTPLTLDEQSLIKRILAYSCLIKNRSRSVLVDMDVKEQNYSSDDLFKGIIADISQLDGQLPAFSETASSSTPMIEAEDQRVNDDSGIEQLYNDYLSNNKALFVLEFNQSLIHMIKTARIDELLVIVHLYPQGFNQTYPQGYMMAWIIATAIQHQSIPLFVVDSLWMQGINKNRADFLPVVHSLIRQLKHLLAMPLNSLDNDKFNLIFDRILDLAFTEPSLTERFYSNADWLVLLASKGYFNQIDRLLSYKPGFDALTKEQFDRLLIVFSQLPISIELIKKIYNLENNQYVTLNHFRDINPVFSIILENALENKNADLFQFLITRQPMCSGHARFLLEKSIAFDEPWAVDILLANPDVVIDAAIVFNAIKLGRFVCAQKMLGHLSLEDNSKLLLHLINETLTAKLTSDQKMNHIALLLRALKIGVPEAALYSLIQLIAQKTRKQKSPMNTFQIIVLGMLFTLLQRERTIDLGPKSPEQSKDDIKLFIRKLGFGTTHPHQKFVFSYFFSVDRWVMHQRAQPGYLVERGAARFVAGANTGYSHWMQKRYFFLGVTDKFFQEYIRFIERQPHEKIILKDILLLLESASMLASKFSVRFQDVASPSTPTIVPIAPYPLLNTGSVDRVYSSSVPTPGHKRLSQSAFFLVTRTEEQSPPESSVTMPDEDLLFSMDEDLSSPKNKS